MRDAQRHTIMHRERERVRPVEPQEAGKGEAEIENTVVGIAETLSESSVISEILPEPDISRIPRWRN